MKGKGQETIINVGGEKENGNGKSTYSPHFLSN